MSKCVICTKTSPGYTYQASPVQKQTFLHAPSPKWLPSAAVLPYLSHRAPDMLDPVQVLWLVAVAALWGLSTPLLRRGGKGVEDIKRDGHLRQWLAEVKFLAMQPQYALPFLINQSGSAIYALALGSADLSLAVPLTNSLNFIFVTLAGRLLGETPTNARTYIGMAFVTTGVTLCVADRAWNQG